MPTPRHRWLIVVAVVALLPVLYVLGAAVVIFADAAGWISPYTASLLRMPFAPLGEYQDAKLPGWQVVDWLWDCAAWIGHHCS